MILFLCGKRIGFLSNLRVVRAFVVIKDDGER